MITKSKQIIVTVFLNRYKVIYMSMKSKSHNKYKILENRQAV